LAWRLLPGFGTLPGAANISATFHPTPEDAPVEVAAPLLVDVTLDLRDTTTNGPRISPSVDLQLRDEQGQPAIFGDGPANPVIMHVGGTFTSWTADMSAPTRPGRYHVYLYVHNSTQGDTEIDLPQPVLEVVPATEYKGGLVYSRNGNLWRTDESGKHPHRLTFYSGDGRAQDPAWMPDGSRIAYARALPAAANEIPNTEIWSIDPTGSDARMLAPRRPDEDMVMPAFAPDGTLLFTSERLIDPDTGATPTIDRYADAIESWSIETAQPADPAGTRKTLLPAARMPNLSPDGKLVAYLSAPDIGGPNTAPVTRTLMLAESNGANPRVLVPDGVFQDIYAPRFSPDGTQIAFAAVNPFGIPSGLNLWQRLGLAPRPVAANGVPWDIYLVPAAGGQPTRLTQLDADQPFPAWSRDGTRLALLTDKALMVVDVANPTAPPRQIGPGSSHGQLAWYDEP
jgi:hypothetical protein